MRQFITTKVLGYALRVRDEDGQGLAEYALILGLIAVVCVGALGFLGQAISDSAGFLLDFD